MYLNLDDRNGRNIIVNDKSVTINVGRSCVVVEDYFIRISDIKGGEIISGITLDTSHIIPKIALEIGLGTINLVEGSRQNRREKEKGLFFTLVSGVEATKEKIFYLTDAGWKDLPEEDVFHDQNFPEDAICIPTTN